MLIRYRTAMVVHPRSPRD